VLNSPAENLAKPCSMASISETAKEGEDVSSSICARERMRGVVMAPSYGSERIVLDICCHVLEKQ
jgi:hypothetical protein